jgi:sarcosine oxidase subunit beta
LKRTADVVIVGAGTTGVSVAFHLARAGIGRVVVLERRFIGAGGTGRSVGIIRQLYPTRETTEMVVRSLAVYRDFDAAVGGASGYVGCGALIGVGPTMQTRLEETMRRQRALGIRAELLAPARATRAA